MFTLILLLSFIAKKTVAGCLQFFPSVFKLLDYAASKMFQKFALTNWSSLYYFDFVAWFVDAILVTILVTNERQRTSKQVNKSPGLSTTIKQGTRRYEPGCCLYNSWTFKQLQTYTKVAGFGGESEQGCWRKNFAPIGVLNLVYQWWTWLSDCPSRTSQLTSSFTESASGVNKPDFLFSTVMGGRKSP